MFNKIFAFAQNKFDFLYKNSLIIQNIDCLILISILAVFVSSVFAQSDTIGMFAILASCLTFINLLLKKGEKLECNKFELFLLIYFILALISLCGSSLFMLSLKGFSKLLIYLSFYLSVVQYLKNHKDKIWLLVFTIAVCVSYEIAQGFIQTIIKPDAISTWQDISKINPEDVISRIYGTLKPYNPNLYGGYLIAALPALFGTTAYFFYKNLNKFAISLGVLSVVSLYVLLQTGCRGAYIALFGILLFMFWISMKFCKQQYKKMYVSAVGFITALGFVFLMSVGALRKRIISMFLMRADSSNSFRFNVYNSCIDMFKDNWLLGIGLGNNNFREIYGLYMKTGFDALSAYNIYLETAVESGIFALLSFIAFLFLLIKSAYRYINSKEYCLDSILVIIALTSIIGLLIHGFVDTVFFRPQIHFIFWTMVAIIRVKESNFQD